MLRTLDILSIVALIGAASWTFSVKHETDLVENEIRKVERKIASEKETIAILSADWTLYNQPARLQALAETYAEDLKLMEIRPDQIVAEHQLPAPPIPKDLTIEDIEAELLASNNTAVQ
ncbi:hypothetical protein U0C82_16550 [Fulvimarina sp. 2208YS6-2-32]|uniref:Cell division protein FtsL n=1 Tax=Fulvimarina uroteuthidis TaxID=3098149 RepID=A0ABU5I7F7_9HYPH|nr:hypothetical protein [Fulvimarina sp. 2208YS6-2-32]MDY8110753.1 hypothetical protein [Fulvimarina sp. 2208YS6-2-32]